MIKVMIDENKALDMLMNRLCEFWHIEPTGETETTYKLFERMYENYIYNGYFDGCEFDPMVIVDNDYVNYCRVIEEGDDEYEEIKAIFRENDLGDCSCETNVCGFIEAEYNGSFLVR